MTLKQAEAIAGALGHPSKMPGYSYGISATRCHTGSQLRNVPGSVCASCYAMSDWYRSWRPLLQGHARRWNGIFHPQWVDAMTFMIDLKCKPPNHYFRWHDSGDLQGVWHLQNIVEVCRRTPAVSHWLPSREYDYVKRFRERDVIPDNLCIRLSAHMIDSDPILPLELKGMPTSTVSSVSLIGTGVRLVDEKGSIECLAVAKRNNTCGGCRACWDVRVKNISYPEH